MSNIVTAQPTSSFPADWLGEWEGELNIYRGNQKLRAIPMRMTIAPTDDEQQINWSTVYETQDGGEVEKPYSLQILDAEKGLYLVDENNSIKIETYLFDGHKLVSWYSVQGSLILASHEMQDGHIVFEIFAGSLEPASVTGGEKTEEEEIPAVTTYPINVMQRAVLHRKNKE